MLVAALPRIHAEVFLVVDVVTQFEREQPGEVRGMAPVGALDTREKSHVQIHSPQRVQGRGRRGREVQPRAG